MEHDCLRILRNDLKTAHNKPIQPTPKSDAADRRRFAFNFSLKGDKHEKMDSCNNGLSIFINVVGSREWGADEGESSALSKGL